MDYSIVSKEIRDLVEREMPILNSLDEETVSKRYNSQDRNIKMILGHLVDSANNNLQRIVRLQYTPQLVFPDYTQDNDLWIFLQDYRNYDWQELTELWKCSQFQIAHIIREIDDSYIDNFWIDYQGNKVSLNRMVYSYPEHLNLHINQIHKLICEPR